MKEAQKVLLSLDATREADSDKTKLLLKREMECSVEFLGKVIKSAMDEDDILAAAVALAILDFDFKNFDVDGVNETIKNITEKK